MAEVAAMLYLSTTDGVIRVDTATGDVARLGPSGTSTEALAVAGGVILAAVTPDYGLPMRRPLRPASHQGLVRSADAGRTWHPVSDLTAASLPVAPGNGAVASGGDAQGVQVTALAALADGFVAGTDPAELVISHDAGRTWTAGRSLRVLPDYPNWSYPLEPHTPHVMLIEPHPVQASTIYAGIEVGGVVRSTDGGKTWEHMGHQRGAAVNPDIHGLAISPADPSVVYAATPRGVFYSDDGGETWDERNDGVEPLYCRPIVTHQRDPRVAVVVATHGASGFFGIPAERTGGTVLQTEDFGRSWRPVTEGLPAPLAPTPAMVADPSRAGVFYLPLFSGAVYVGEDGGATWRELAGGLPPILRAVAA